MANNVVHPDRAADAALAIASDLPDSWIPVSAEVGEMLDRGAPLAEVVTVIGAGGASGGSLFDVLRCSEPGCTGQLGTRVRMIDATSDDYPRKLRVVAGRPLLLYVKGRLPATERAALAIVGSRRASERGRNAAHEIGKAVAAAGRPVVSGLADGIDTAAHRGALAAGGVTVAVMGTGINRVFPESNRELADQITDNGALVTQFAPDQGPSKTTFPARNALIAAMSDASLLVELAERSGTRIEAERALEQGRPVWMWKPIMGRARWAREYERRAGVSFVNSIDEILARLDELDQ